ncbi:MAG TPA: Sec-independent protein translocase subunit TatA [Pseudonocardiaceae bacterium]|jgi:sec-independent protein translocase protein TatA|nr:Sec-independent protein translocase subunit TatA [Pseudonocardiaceae bacterium]
MIPTGWELILLLGVLVLLFGATKLPTAARSIGQSLRIFKAETKGLRADDEDTSNNPQQVPPPQAAQPPRQVPPPPGPRAVGAAEESQRDRDTRR